MAIKRYTANADNTITNAYKEDFNNRGTGSNMGFSDILETFSLYAHRDSSSAELSRIMVQFPVSDISSDRTSGKIPASGSVSFYLRMFNAEHTRTLPVDYKLTINAISAEWEEGYGLDMANYSDLTYDKVGSNWINANGTSATATATVTVANDGFIEAGDTITLIATDGTVVVATAHATTTTSTAATTAVQFARNGGSNSAVATAIATAINHSSYFSAAAEGAVVTITQAVAGHGGNTAVTCVDGGGAGPWFTKTNFTGGSGKWSTAGGDFYTDASSSFEQRFEIGTEDLEVDVTTLVEQWVNSGGNVLGSKNNYGVMVKLSGAYEASSSTNSIGARKSYYTKKFFARSSEFFFDRPILEARWDSTRRDNRGNFLLSSSALPAADNLNTLYMYNYVRGKLRDIRGLSTQVPVMRLFYSSGSVPEGTAQYFRNSSNAIVSYLSASRVSTGVYKVIFSATSSVTTSTYPNLVDVWSYSGSEIHTGSAISPKTYYMTGKNPDSKYVITMPNLKKQYMNQQTERFRLYVRNKNWSPNIYTKAVSTRERIMVDTASYQITRMSDNRVVIPYGTSSTNHTVMSYDVSGNYFDLDLSMLESGYTYRINYSFYEDGIGSYVEQPYSFKIRVVKNEY